MNTERQIHKRPVLRLVAGRRESPTLAIRLAVLRGELPESYAAAILEREGIDPRKALAEAANVPVGDA